MITFKCKMCGGDLHPEENATTCECEYCGSVQTIPTADNEKKGNLFNRANRLRMAAEYDKAAAVYTSITAEFPEEAEAYWGLCLCKYGIEYVEDPATAKKIPTCHRTRSESIMDDPDFDQACENADAVAKRVYREEAKAIDRLQQDILSVVANESPYDVFICYKETDDDGQRTEDSVLAQDIYDSLTAKGLKVFFARITLEDKLGQQYEPYIYAALHSAKVMLAIGTQFEYFDAVWVKNEWSRFLDMMKMDKSKTLIPCYKNIDAYDMPREFKSLQGQDMGKLGWLQDLIRGIKKILHKDEVKPQTVVQPTLAAPAGNVAPLLKRAFMFLEDGNWDSANEYAERVLDVDPEYGRAYLVKLMVDLKVRGERDLKNQPQPFDGESNYQKIMRFGDESLKKQVQENIDYINNRNEYERQKGIYQHAMGTLQVATTLEQCKEAKQHFQTIPYFEGADQMLAACDLRIEEIKRLNKLQSEAGEKVNRLHREMNEKKRALRRAYNDEVQAWQSAEKQYGKAKDALKQARQHKDAVTTLISRAQGELQSLRGLFTSRRRRELETEITEQQKKKNSVDAEIHALEMVLARAEAARRKEPVVPDIPDEREVYYSCAGIYREAHMYEDAWKIYSKLKGFKDVDSILENDDNIAALASAATSWRAQFEVGNTVQFGRYERDNNTPNGVEAIEWIVLVNDGDNAMLISKYGLDAKPYNTQRTNVTWEACTMRKWLNGYFLNDAFSIEEQTKLETVTVKADKNAKYDTDPGNDTQDTVFLLSIDEANALFPSNAARVCQATEYAKAQGAFVGKNGNSWWWLRSPGDGSNFAASVCSIGSIGSHGNYVNSVNFVVRPVIVLRLL